MITALDEDERSASRPGRALAPGKDTPVPIVQEVWVGPTAVLVTEATGKILFASADDRTSIVRSSSP
jgi:hypothetical protein